MKRQPKAWQLSLAQQSAEARRVVVLLSDGRHEAGGLGDLDALLLALRRDGIEVFAGFDPRAGNPDNDPFGDFEELQRGSDNIFQELHVQELYAVFVLSGHGVLVRGHG
mgnify:CR=1 FL=1